jgi:PAS domain S-box-containing protein
MVIVLKRCLFIVATLLPVLSSRGGEDAMPPGAAPSGVGLKRVTLQLSWRHQFQFAGYYMAKEMGFYREAGLDVEFRERKEGVDCVGQVVSGRSDFGICNERLIAEYLKGASVVVLAAILQHSPTCDFGMDAYGELLFTSGRRVQEEPELVLAFREASLRGWEYALEHMEETVEHILKAYTPDAGREKLMFEARTFRGLAVNDLVALGHVNRKRWKHVVRRIAEVEGLSPEVLPAGCGERLLVDHYLACRWKHWRYVLTLALAVFVGGNVLWIGVAWVFRCAVKRRTVELSAANERLAQENAIRRKAAEELRQSEALFKAIAEGIFDGVSLTGEDRRYLYVNPQLARMYGYSEGELLGETFDRLLVPDEARRLTQFFEERLAGCRRHLARYETLFRRKDGTALPVEISSNEVELHGRRAVIAVHRDISERKRLIRDLVKIVEWERRRIGQDLHDTIGQELTGIAYLIGALRLDADALRPEQAAALGQILDICQGTHRQLRGIVAGLLPLSADETLVDGLARLARNTRERLGVVCELCTPCGMQLNDLAKAGHLFQIAQEAVANAVRHGQATQIRITFETDSTQGFLQIDDNGCGFDVDRLKPGGSGITIMRYRADILGGTVVFNRRDGGGMSVQCTFGVEQDGICGNGGRYDQPKG